MTMTDKPQFRKTKIIATVGPACDDVDILTRMIQSGDDITRMREILAEWDIDTPIIAKIQDL